MNISLIGMMGCGKTTIGKLLSDELNFKFVDTDALIVQNENSSINEIFEKKGEDYFREVEHDILLNVLKSDNQIISTGGGIVKLSSNIDLLKNKSISYYLQADTETLYHRVKDNSDRPLLNNVDIKNKIEFLLSQRIGLYEKADYVINTVNKSPNEIVKEILDKISCEK